MYVSFLPNPLPASALTWCLSLWAFWVVVELIVWWSLLVKCIWHVLVKSQKHSGAPGEFYGYIHCTESDIHVQIKKRRLQ